MMLARNALIALLWVSLWGPPVASAQSTPEELAALNREAMDAYNNLDIDEAKNRLAAGAARAERAGVRGPVLATTYANLGVIYVGGLQDEDAGLAAFVRALEEDSSVRPDPLVSTPDIQRVFGQARARVLDSTPPGPEAPEGNLRHLPVAEQLPQTGVPVFVENSGLEVARMRVFYRSLGVASHNSLDLEPMGDGFGGVIPCADVFEPAVEYYVTAFDKRDREIGHAGTRQRPVLVRIVPQLSGLPPSLPGRPPPEGCGDSACPPGRPGCQTPGGPGDACRSGDDCGGGLSCDDNICVLDRVTAPEAEDDEDVDIGPRFFFDMGPSLNAVYVAQNMRADSPPPLSLFSDLERQRDEGMISDEEFGPLVQQVAADAGWDCRVVRTPDGRTGLDDCRVAADQPGFVSNLALQGAAGFFVSPKVYLALSGRMQLDGQGRGTLAGIVLGSRIGYLVTPPGDAFRGSLFIGGSVGQIQVQAPNGRKSSPYVTSGLAGVQVGTSLSYRLAPNFGIVLVPHVHFMMPTFLFALDGMGGIELAF